MTVREAVPGDRPRLLEMGRHFFAVSGLDSMRSLSEASYGASMASFMESERAVLLVAEMPGGIIGMAAAILVKPWYNRTSPAAQEMFWWVEPEARGTGAGAGLLREMEKWATQKGARTFVMGALEAQRPEALSRLYRSRGYVPRERLFMKELDHGLERH